MDICKKNECSGCGVCTTVCSRHAISMEEKQNGHLYPVVDEAICVSCGACTKVCSNNNLPVFRNPSAAFIATAVDKNESVNSTSAGIASVLSRLIIRNGGVVYGCCGEEIDHIKHIRVVDENDLSKLKGSKYVQSSLCEVLPLLKEDIKSGRTTLFIGTPCQVAGVQQYLHTPDNLITIDIICHGVPSQRLLIDAIKDYLPNKDLSHLRINFRKKVKGKSLYGFFVEDNNGNVVYSSTYPSNEYITGFLSGLFYRESCYQCHYAKPERVSDITLGDYWDHGENVEITNKEGGMSMLIINTNKGERLVNNHKDYLHMLPSEYISFVKRNGQLHHPIKKDDNYQSFLYDYGRMGFIHAAKKNLWKRSLEIRIHLALNRISSLKHKVFG